MVKKSKFKFSSIRNIRGKIVNIDITEDIRYNNNGELDLKYGFDSKLSECKAYEPGLGWEKYRLHSSIQPREGDTLTHVKSGRVFTFGKVRGFVCYTIQLLENGVEVAVMHYEDYYKD